jgi:glutamyl-tRNA synthetase
VNTSQMDDKVLLKSDGMPTYHLANICDDYLMGISHVIRGEEWLPSAPLHVLLYRALGWENVMPKFAHLPLLLKPDGNGKLSKRDGDRLGFPVFPLQWTDPATKEISSGYKQSGYLPQAVLNMLAFLGWNPGTQQEIFSKEELIAAFSIERISKSGAKFDSEKAKWFNQQYLRSLPDEDLANAVLEVAPQLKDEVSFTYLKGVCALIKEKVTFVKDIIVAGAYFFAEPMAYDAMIIEKKKKDFTIPVLKELIESWKDTADFTHHNLEQIFLQILAARQLKTGDMLQILRVYITGVGSGPHLFEICELLGKGTVLKRLEKAIALDGSAGISPAL